MDMSFDVLSGMMGGSAALIAALALFIPLAVGLPIMIVQSRQTSAEDQDNQVALKCVLYFIYSLGILMFLFGLTILALDFIVAGKWFSDAQERVMTFSSLHRNAAALMLSGFVFYFFHLVLIMGHTNNYKQPYAGKFWVSWRLVVHSLVILAVTTAIIFEIMTKIDVTEEKHLRPYLAILVVWLPSWLIHLAVAKNPKAAKPVRKTGEGDEERPVRPAPVRPAPQPAQRPATSGQRPATGPAQRPVQRPAPRKPADEE